MSSEAAIAVERAEREPVLGCRFAPVRAAIDAAAPLLDGDHAEPALRARLLLRLAEVQLVESDWEGAEQALEAAARHVPDDTALRVLAALRECRVAIRRGPAERAVAQRTVLATVARFDQLADASPTWREVTLEIALAIGELAVHDDPPEPSAFEPLIALVAELAHDPRRFDFAFTARGLIAMAALSRGELAPAATALRANAKLAQSVGSPADEVEARLALAGALVESGDPIALAEATRTVQIARDRALEHGLVELHHAAVLAQAGALSAAGKTAGAIDRVLELARTAAASGDLQQYVAAVAVMAELYTRSGDHVSAFRTIVETHRALATATRDDPTDLFRPLLARLRDKIGGAKLDKIAADVDQANRLADAIAAKKPNDSR